MSTAQTSAAPSSTRGRGAVRPEHAIAGGSSLTCQSACSPSPRYGGAGSRTGESCARLASTQDALYAEIDLDLSWSERDLPERERTKHVHRLHPYLGKFIPQLAETLLERYVARGGHVLDPFAGSGTTLVQALESGFDATGVDIAAFNCLLMRVKTQHYNLFVLERELRDVVLATRRRDAHVQSRPVTCANGSRRRPRASSWRSASSPRSTSIATCCASFSRAPRDRRD